MRLIDADKLKEVIWNNVYLVQDVFNSRDCGMFWTGGIEKAIDEAPTIDAEPVSHGRWIECESENGIHIHKCSECGKRDMYKGAFKDFNGRGFSFYYKRQCCPVCGARMEIEV